jgi:hypothetical protein
MTPYRPTFLQLVDEKFQEIGRSNNSVVCFCDLVGRISIDLHRLVHEVSLDFSEQDSENALEILVAIAVTAACAAEDLVLPELREKEE